MKWILLPLLLIGCTPGHYQNLASLRHELNSAKEKLSSAHARVIQLEEEIAKQEIAKIKLEIEKIQNEEPQDIGLTREERLAFFAEQREILAMIIKNNLNCTSDAQVVLNKILTYITEMSDTAAE